MSNESEAEDAEQDASDENDVEAADETEAQADEGTESEETEESESEGLQRGDFVRIDYTARTVEGGHLVDTTDPDVAEEEGVGEDQEFAPRTIVLGEGHVFPMVEEDIVGKEVGDSGSVTVPAAEAFGEVDDDQVRTIPTNKIPEDDRYPGAHVEIEGEQGHIETIIGGRARVDFNHPLAGDDVEYEYEILEEVEDRQEKAEGLLDIFLDLDLEMWFETDVVEEEQLVEPDEDDGEESEADEEAAADDEGEDGADDEDAEPEYETVEVEKETLYIEATPQLTMNQQWMMGKTQIAQQLTQMLDIDRIIVQEELGGGGMMGGLGGMMGGMGGGGGDLEEALEDEDIDADEIVEEIEGAQE